MCDQVDEFYSFSGSPPFLHCALSLAALLHQTGFLGKCILTISSWLNFGRPAPPGRGLSRGEIFGSAILQPARSVCVSLGAFFIPGRIAAKRQTAGIKFTHRPKIRFFAPYRATRCTDSGQTLQSRWAPGSAWLCKISPQSPQGVGMRPQKCQKFPLFGKELRGDSLDRFLKFLGAFIRLTILH